MKKIISYILVGLLFLLPISTVEASQTIKLTKPVSSGVTLNQYTHKGTYTNQINHLAIDLNDPYTKVKVGLPEKFGGLATTTAIGLKDSKEGNRVVGGINAAFYDMSNGLPIYLISLGNEIYNGGIISNSPSAYVSQPMAFGVTADGKAEIDSFEFNINVAYKEKNIKITGINRIRQENESIIFTPQFSSATTNSNKFGVEYVVETPENITSTHFNQKLSGVVKQIRPYGSTEKITIPKNGFVISANGSKMADFQSLNVGDEVSLAISINEKWQNSEFMLASGPQLVRDGKPNITMDTSSSRAREVTSRSAIAISADKAKVHFITVDGKQSNSKGMNLVQFANYIASLGYDRAINLDGGGSTTMAYRNHGSNNLVLANSPSGGSQRRVSAILEAVSTAHTSAAKSVKYSRTNAGTMLAGAGSTVTTEYFLDQYYNPLPLDATRISLASENGTLDVRGMTFISTKAADDRIVILYDGKAVDSFPVKVVDAPTNLSISGSKQIESGKKASYTLSAKDSEGKDLIYNASQASWKVEGDIGTITNDGVFTAMKPGKGKVTVTLGQKTASLDVEVKEKGIFIDVPTSHPYYKEITALVNKKYITGYEDGTFKPEGNLTRAHAAVIISRALGLDTSKVVNPQFKDIPTSHNYYKEIAAVQNAGIISGKQDGNFDPNGQLTRGQMAKIIAKAYKLTGISTIQFKDVKPSDWQYEYVQALAYNNVTTGYSDGTFKPYSNITRAHFSVFLYRTIQ